MEARVPTIDYQELVKEDRVHGSLYYDPAIFQQELERIWYRGWVYVGHESEIPDPGDFVTSQIGLQPVIMVRDKDRKVQLFLNRCRHRGNIVCQDGRGSARFFRCDYHGWTYSSEGDLVRVTYGDGYGASFRKEDYGLTRVVRKDSYRGLVFGSLAPSGISLEQHLGGAREFIDMFVDLSPEGQLELRAGVQKTRYRGNWKMMAENSLEGTYHGHFLHQYFFELVKSRSGFDPSAPANAQAPGHIRYLPGGHMVEDFRAARRRPVSLAAEAEETSGPWRAYVEAMEKRFGKDKARQVLTDGSQFIYVFPNVILLQTHVRRIQPVSVDETYVYYQPALLKGAPPEINEGRLREHEGSFGPAGFLASDDLDISERNQLGIRARVDDWLILGRGLHREQIAADGVCVGCGTDEGQLRGLWRHYKKVMLGRPSAIDSSKRR